MFFCEIDNFKNKYLFFWLKLPSIYFVIVITCICHFLSLTNSIFAESFSREEISFFEDNLKNTAKRISNKIIESKKKVIIAVIDILNYKTQERESRGEFLEEQLTEYLIEVTPYQVVPYFEIVSLRMELTSRFPEILDAPLTEKIAKLADADWLLTGKYENEFESFVLNLKLLDLKSGDLIWETVVGSEEIEEIEPNKIATLSDAKNKSEFKLKQFSKSSSQLPYSYFKYFSLDTDDLDSKQGFLPSIIDPSFEDRQSIPRGMVKIPEGEFVMGSEYGDDELPDHLVFIKSFFLDKYEVTNLDYSGCKICERGQGGFDSLDPEKPVVYVDWSNAYAFCKFQNKRLPTEAEWEYAARAGNEENSFSENIKVLENYAWIQTNTEDVGFWGAKKVGTKTANNWGIFDLSGNVMEWVQNYYMPDYFVSLRQQKNPVGPLLPSDEDYPLRVVRGGAWGGLYGAGTPEGVRVSKRYAFVEWTRSFQIGFRCAMDLPVES